MLLSAIIYFVAGCCCLVWRKYFGRLTGSTSPIAPKTKEYEFNLDSMQLQFVQCCHVIPHSIRDVDPSYPNERSR